MGRVVHFEIAADDVTRACKFFSDMGWEITDAHMPGGTYMLAKTGDSAKPGIDGAIMPRGYSPKQAVRITVEVEDLEEAIEKVKAAGGTIDGDIADIPFVGRYVNILDTEGNQHGLLQPTAAK